jgi:two-component system cell cycle sensor histidine kinase/response regulator CckA
LNQRSDPWNDAASLRRRAEEVLESKERESPETEPLEEVERLLHELRVHQIELEMQNEELRRAQAELDASRERYFDLYDLAPVGYLTLSEQGLILEANLTAASLLGVARGALVNRRFTNSILPEDEDVYYLHRKQLFATNHPQVCDVRILRPGRTPFWARLEAAVAEDAAGRLISRLVISDVTASKLAAEARLTKAQEMESVGLLAGGIAHDFNNLLTVVNGYSKLLLEGLPANDPLRDGLEEICKAGTRAAELTQQLLAYARKQVILPRLLDLDALVRKMLPLLERLMDAHVAVRLELNPEAGSVLVDPHQLEQVLMNLALNARDAMPGGGTLLIETCAVERDAGYAASHPEVRAGRYVMLAVSDSGEGMNEETRQRIFEPFFTTKEAGKGTGLGLSMVQGVVSQSGGHIEVTSEPGRGSTFRVYLPKAAEPRVAPAGTVESTPPRRGKETVLVVEDQDAVCDFAERVLITYGYRVLKAANGISALALCEQERGNIDLVLTDIVMPRMGGLALANRLKEHWPGMRILFMSGYSRGAMAAHGAWDDTMEFIQKPFSPELLSVRVREVLDSPDKALAKSRAEGA